mgnify:CR=1 FL=1
MGAVSANVPTKRELKDSIAPTKPPWEPCFSKCPYEEGTESLRTETREFVLSRFQQMSLRRGN